MIIFFFFFAILYMSNSMRIVIVVDRFMAGGSGARRMDSLLKSENPSKVSVCLDLTSHLLIIKKFIINV